MAELHSYELRNCGNNILIGHHMKKPKFDNKKVPNCFHETGVKIRLSQFCK